MVDSKKPEATVVEDVEMKSPEPVVDEATKKLERDNFVFEELKEHAKQIEKGVIVKEPRFILRILRSLPATRKNVNSTVLRRVINTYYNSVPNQRDALLAYIEESMETESAPSPGVTETKTPSKGGKLGVSSFLPEHDVYFHLLVVVHLLDLKSYANVSFFLLIDSVFIVMFVCRHWNVQMLLWSKLGNKIVALWMF